MRIDEPSLGIAPRPVQDIFVAIDGSPPRDDILLVEQNTRLALAIQLACVRAPYRRNAKTGVSKALADDPEIREAYLGR